MTPNIVAEKLRAFVPDELAPTQEAAGLRAMTFSTLAIQTGTPIVTACVKVEGGWRVDIEEASRATTEAKRAG